jgi:hypothetical protein
MNDKEENVLRLTPQRFRKQGDHLIEEHAGASPSNGVRGLERKIKNKSTKNHLSFYLTIRNFIRMIT